MTGDLLVVEGRPGGRGVERHRGHWWRTLARTSGEVLLTFGAVVLLFAVYQLWGTGLETARAQDRLADDVRHAWSQPSSTLSFSPAPSEGFARLHAPSLPGVDPWIVVEGVGVEDLKKGPGHMPGTALPGQLGNVVLSGHRTTYGAPFNRWDELRAGDEVVLETGEAWFTYTMTGAQVVEPDAVDVALPVPGRLGAIPTAALLTMTTCEPEYSAAQRLVLRAELTARTPRSAGPPAVLATTSP
jgi:sortase A